MARVKQAANCEQINTRAADGRVADFWSVRQTDCVIFGGERRQGRRIERSFPPLAKTDQEGEGNIYILNGKTFP